MYIVFGNYGNETVALMQWLFEQKIEKPVYVVSVHTGWAAQNWHERVASGEALARDLGFTPVRLSSTLDFSRLIEQQQNFPSTKYQWCAGFLKGLIFLDWLDSIDPSCESLILLGKYREKSPALTTLPEFIEESEHYGERNVQHPLLHHTKEEIMALIERSGLSILNHRSLECDPCVNNTNADFLRLSKIDIEKTATLEKKIEKPMFALEGYGDSKGIEQVIQWVKKQPKSAKVATIEINDMGCGSPFACGL